jgi:hypothetical protein
MGVGAEGYGVTPGEGGHYLRVPYGPGGVIGIGDVSQDHVGRTLQAVPLINGGGD